MAVEITGLGGKMLLEKGKINSFDDHLLSLSPRGKNIIATPLSPLLGSEKLRAHKVRVPSDGIFDLGFGDFTGRVI